VNFDDLRLKRLEARLSGDAVCRQAGISRSRLSGIERGTVIPSESEIERLSAVIDQLRLAQKEARRIAESLGCHEFFSI
jgi:transcriptional regulator with XRE-family HTH domain